MTALRPGGPRTRTTVLAAGTLALAGLLAACGGGGDSTATVGGSASPTGSASPGDGRGPFAGMDLQAVQSCLEAAGVSMPAFPSGRPSFSGTARPTFSRDPNRTGRPSGTGFPDRRGPGGTFFTDPKVKAALEACGITVPSFTPRAQPSVPTDSPSS